jgi:hypothetical protein
MLHSEKIHEAISAAETQQDIETLDRLVDGVAVRELGRSALLAEQYGLSSPSYDDEAMLEVAERGWIYRGEK